MILLSVINDLLAFMLSMLLLLAYSLHVSTFCQQVKDHGKVLC